MIGGGNDLIRKMRVGREWDGGGQGDWGVGWDWGGREGGGDGREGYEEWRDVGTGTAKETCAR